MGDKRTSRLIHHPSKTPWPRPGNVQFDFIGEVGQPLVPTHLLPVQFHTGTLRDIRMAGKRVDAPERGSELAIVWPSGPLPHGRAHRP
jgi:hypothetical protein